MAFVIAAVHGHAGALALFLQRKDIQINHIDRKNQTALILAAEWGKANVVTLVLDKEDIQKDCRDRTIEQY